MKTKYISLQYIKDKSEIIGSKIKKRVKEYFPIINVRVAFKSPAQIGHHFPFNDKVEDPK